MGKTSKGSAINLNAKVKQGRSSTTKILSVGFIPIKFIDQDFTLTANLSENEKVGNVKKSEDIRGKIFLLLPKSLIYGKNAVTVIVAVILTFNLTTQIRIQHKLD